MPNTQSLGLGYSDDTWVRDALVSTNNELILLGGNSKVGKEEEITDS